MKHYLLQTISLVFFSTYGFAQMSEPFPHVDLMSNWIGDEWVESYGFITESEEGPYGSCRPTERQFCSLSNGQSDCDGLYTWTYDDLNRISNEVSQSYNDNTQEWTILNQSMKTYDLNWRIISNYHESFINGIYSDYYQTFEYDLEGNLVLEITFNSNEVGSSPNMKKEYSYDSNGNLIQLITYYMNSDTEMWEEQFMENYTYTNGVLESKLNLTWSDLSSSYENSYLDTYEYSNEQKVVYRGLWDPVLLQFVPFLRNTYTLAAGTEEIESSVREEWNADIEIYENDELHEYSDWCFPTVGVENIKNQDWTLLGNPSDYPIIEVPSGNSNELTFQVNDLMGRIVLKKTLGHINAGTLEFPELGVLNPGIYLLVLTDLESERVMKWTKR